MDVSHLSASHALNTNGFYVAKNWLVDEVALCRYELSKCLQVREGKPFEAEADLQALIKKAIEKKYSVNLPLLKSLRRSSQLQLLLRPLNITHADALGDPQLSLGSSLLTRDSITSESFYWLFIPLHPSRNHVSVTLKVSGTVKKPIEASAGDVVLFQLAKTDVFDVQSGESTCGIFFPITQNVENSLKRSRVETSV